MAHSYELPDDKIDILSWAVVVGDESVFVETIATVAAVVADVVVAVVVVVVV